MSSSNLQNFDSLTPEKWREKTGAANSPVKNGGENASNYQQLGHGLLDLLTFVKLVHARPSY